MADVEIFDEEPQEEGRQILQVILTNTGLVVHTRLSNELTTEVVEMIAQQALDTEIDHTKTIQGD